MKKSPVWILILVNILVWGFVFARVAHADNLNADRVRDLIRSHGYKCDSITSVWSLRQGDEVRIGCDMHHGYQFALQRLEGRWLFEVLARNAARE